MSDALSVSHEIHDAVNTVHRVLLASKEVNEAPRVLKSGNIVLHSQ